MATHVDFLQWEVTEYGKIQMKLDLIKPFEKGLIIYTNMDGMRGIDYDMVSPAYVICAFDLVKFAEGL